MKTTVGLIFLFAVINASYSISLRELAFMKSLYAREDMPKLVLTAMVNRRIDEIRTLYERKPILEDAKIFCNSTEQSLQLLLDSMDSNNTRTGDLSESYSHIVRLINDVKSIMGIHNVDYLTMDSRYSFSRDNLQAMMDAYIGDIEMARKCEVSLGRPNRVDMKIVERIKSLSNEMRNYYFPKDDGFFAEVSSISRKTMDQCLWRFEFLLNKFTATFINLKM
ncbi:uncharacterized protein LOC107370505 isoform X5 [Tetranychus urticae]|uniref:uncharacterized protein LOC107370505 isoform X5 n=1 Tax=Tetranychus urticae TaxID=32264 RepID=UPI000D653E85|nr:uncharacterized protein LOC107370505 isoform X5 [Tetranychus urticae]